MFYSNERFSERYKHRLTSAGIVLTVCLLLLFPACGSKGCYDNTDVKVKCTFYQVDESKSISLTGLSVWGLGKDSLLYKNQTTGDIDLELNPKASITRYVVKLASNDRTFYDTLTFYYTTGTWFQSMDCDCMTFSTLDSCTTTGAIFRSATLKQPVVNNTKTTHVVLNL